MRRLLQLLLAASPPSPASAAPPQQDSLTGLYLLVGTAVVAQLGAALVGLFKWLGSRTVAREDADKLALSSGIASVREELAKQRREFEDKLKERDEELKELGKTVLTLTSDLKQAREQLATVKATVEATSANVEGRIDKQAEHYRQEVAKHADAFEKRFGEMEYHVRQDAMRAMKDAQAVPQTSFRKRR